MLFMVSTTLLTYISSSFILSIAVVKIEFSDSLQIVQYFFTAVPILAYTMFYA